VIYVDEAGTSTRCPLHGDGCGIRVYRGLLKCTQLNEIFNADIAAARNILKTQVTEGANNPRAPKRGGGNGRRPGQGLNLPKGKGCSPNLPTPSRGRGRVLEHPDLDRILTTPLNILTPLPLNPYFSTFRHAPKK